MHIFPAQTIATSPTFVNVDGLWGARIPDYTNDALGRDDLYKYVILAGLGLNIGSSDLRMWKVERAGAAWKKVS